MEQSKLNRFTSCRHHAICHWVLVVLVIFLAVVSSIVSAAQAGDGAMPEAGTRIRAQATVTYMPSGSRHPVTIESNVTVIEVLPVEALSFDGDRQVRAVPGMSVTIPFQLANTGNTHSIYTFETKSLSGFALDNLSLYLDTNNNGSIDEFDRPLPPGATLSLSPQGRASLLIHGNVPIGVTGEANVRLRAMAQGSRIDASAKATIYAVQGAVMQLTQTAAPGSVNPGDAVKVTLSSKNVGLETAEPVARIEGRAVKIDGQERNVILMRNLLPAGVTYVPGSLQSGNAEALLLVRNKTDAEFQYRAATGVASGDVVEVAIALPVALPSGRAFDASFSMKVAPKFTGKHISNIADTYYGQGTAPAQQVTSNRVSIRVGGTRHPDLVPQVTQEGDFIAGGKAAFLLRAINQGNGDTTGEIEIKASMPPGVNAISAQGPGWRCQVSERMAHCKTAQLLIAGTHLPHIQLMTEVSPDAVPGDRPSVVRDAIVTISGGGEPDHLEGNNKVTYRTTIFKKTGLSGRVWLDSNHNERFDEGESLLPGWRVQLLQDAPDTPEGFVIVGEATTDKHGAYQMALPVAGKNFSLRFLSPQGQWYGVPQDGAKASRNTASGVRDFDRGLLRYSQIKPGSIHQDQSLGVRPSGIVYDAVARHPVANALVTLKTEIPSFDPKRHLIGGEANTTVKTDENGYYYFGLSSNAPVGQYQLDVQASGYRGFSSIVPPQAQPLRMNAGLHKVVAALKVPSGNDPVIYHTAFIHAADARPVNNHLAIDSSDPQAFALQLSKKADRPAVEIIDFVNYTLTLQHAQSSAIQGITIQDDLPTGFAYVPHSARLTVGELTPANGKLPALSPIADPLVQGKQLQFQLKDVVLPPNVPANIIYRVRVGATVREGTKATNRAKAYAGPLASNEASATVNITGGVFSTDAFVAGKVFLDCDGDRIQTAGEPGVPGVRVYLEDGTYAETDPDGKYSLYGLKPLTHVLKLDPTTLPQGARAMPISSRNAKRGDTRFLDLRNGELGRGDFALTCDAAILAEVKARREKAVMPEIEAALKPSMSAQYSDTRPANTKARPASGIITPNGANGSAAMPVKTAPAQISVIPSMPIPAAQSGHVASAPPAAGTLMPLEEILPSANTSLGFVDLSDGTVLDSRQTAVRVKGPLGARFVLSVNGVTVPEDRVARRSTLRSRGVTAWEYLGVDLRTGRNELSLSDGSSQERIVVIVPGELAHIDLKIPPHPVADGKTEVPVTIRLTDAAGVPVTRRIPVTLGASAGQWQTRDLDPTQDGIQTFVEGGEGHFKLIAPTVPGEVEFRIVSGLVSTDHAVTFVPALRPVIAVGILEGVITLRNGLIEPVSRNNGFEQELTRLSREWSGGRDTVGGRAAFFLKGQVKGEYLLTAAFDSEKDVKDRLFRDIQPDRYYPIYGDSSVRGFDAQSTSRLYLRVDKDSSYLLYGDFSTSSSRDVRQLTQYDRAVTGLKHHFENERVKANAFVSRDNLVQRKIEIPAEGISGPYTVFGADYVENSERVEIITYDRNAPGVVVKTQLKTRFVDYEIETLSGRLRFREPVPSYDPLTMNPNVIRITYESNGNGPKFWLFGGDVQLKLTDRITLGAVAVDDQNPADARRLQGITLQAKIGERTKVAGELARTDTMKKGVGQGARVEVTHESERIKGKLRATRTNEGFDNISAPVSAGRTDVRAEGAYRVDDRTRVKGEFIHSQDHTQMGNGATNLSGAMVAVERNLTERLQAEFGSRIVETLQQMPDGSMRDIHLNTLRGRLTTVVPGLPKATAYGEYEQDLRDSRRRVFALGGDYRLNDSSRLYGRHEILSSLGSLYNLNSNQRTFRTMFGIDTQYMPDGRVFSEYRLGSALDGRDAQAALGLRNGFNIAEGVRLNTTFERTRSVGGFKGGNNESTALTGGLEYFANPRWKGSTSLELRRATNEDSLLHTIMAAVKLDQDWTLLGRSVVFRTLGRGNNATANSLQTRQRLGVAYRQTERNDLNLLGYYEHRFAQGRMASTLSDRRREHILALVANGQLLNRTTLTGRYAFKHLSESGYGVSSDASAHLVSGRITWDLGRDWDVGLNASTMFDDTFQRRDAFGAEVGYQLKDNLWLSVGHNIVGFSDRIFTEMAQTSKGVYFRVRYKFDENSFFR